MAKPLTDAAIKAAKPNRAKRIEISDGTLPALRLVVNPSGAKSYAVRYKMDGKSRKLTIGSTEAFSLAAARQAARDALGLIERGVDPARKKQTDKIERIKAAEAEKAARENLVEKAYEDFIARHARIKKSGHEIERLMRVEVIPVWKGKRIDEITRRDVVRLVDNIAARGAPTTAKRTLANLSKSFNWFIGKSYAGLTSNPCHGVEKPAPEVARDRVLTDRELHLILKASDKMGSPWRGFIRLLMLTGVRRDEAASSRWEEFSLVGEKPFWLLPGERVKNGRGHILPLAPEAVDILAKLDRVGVAGFVFTTTGETPVSGFAKMKSRLDALMLAIAREECSERGGDPNDVEIKPWRLHDLRRTVATGMADIGIGPHIVEAVLNHVSGAKASVAGVYNRAAYESEKRIALLAWASRIKRLETDGYQVAPITTPLEVQS